MADPYRTPERPPRVRGPAVILGVRVIVPCRVCGGGCCVACGATGREEATADLDDFVALLERKLRGRCSSDTAGQTASPSGSND